MMGLVPYQDIPKEDQRDEVVGDRGRWLLVLLEEDLDLFWGDGGLDLGDGRGQCWHIELFDVQ